MFILDTDVIIWLFRNNPDKIAAIKVVINKEVTIISTITVAEFCQNIFPSEVIAFEDLLNNLTIIPVDLPVAKLAGAYWQEHHKKLKNLSLDDCLVAATAKQQNAKVLTYNRHHFPMSDIKVVTPRS